MNRNTMFLCPWRKEEASIGDPHNGDRAGRPNVAGENEWMSEWMTDLREIFPILRSESCGERGPRGMAAGEICSHRRLGVSRTAQRGDINLLQVRDERQLLGSSRVA